MYLSKWLQQSLELLFGSLRRSGIWLLVVKDVAKIFLASGASLPSIATVDRTLNITAGSPVLELVAPPTDIEHVESPLEPLQLPSLS